MNTGRRTFLFSSLAAATSAAASRSANDRIRVAIVGLRGRGRDLIRGFHDIQSQNVEIAAFCDVDQTVMRQRAADFEKETSLKPVLLDDMRRAMDDKSIDAIAFATPNHWHALGTIWACQAGKDVYCEKPGTHNFWEGLQIQKAADKYQRIVQHGTQNRSSPNIVEAVAKLKEGVIGRVYIARGITFKAHPPMPKAVEAPVPPGLDWDKWLGPAPKVPYSKRIQGSSGAGWHLLWDYGCGDIGNQGVHELDIIRWALDLKDYPSKAVSMGGPYVYNDDQPSPQVQAMMFEWPGRNVLVTFETRGGWTNTEAGMGDQYPFLDHQNVVGVIFIGTEGHMIIPDYTSYYTFMGRKRTPGPSKVGDGTIETTPHVANFIAAVRSRKPSDLAAPPEELHKSASLAHFANISNRVGRAVYFDPAANRFRGDDEANALLRRTYRSPYVVPENV
jgi:predicted dehydrogenase